MSGGSFHALGCLERRPGPRLLLPFIPLSIGAVILFLPALVHSSNLFSIDGWLALVGVVLLVLGGIWGITGGRRRSRSFGVYQVDFSRNIDGTIELCYRRIKDLSGHDTSSKDKEVTYKPDYVKTYPSIPLSQMGGKGGGIPIGGTKATLAVGVGGSPWQLLLGFVSAQEMLKVSSELKGGIT